MPNAQVSALPVSTIPLSQAPVGATVTVRAIEPTEAGLEVRLERIGFLPGTRVRVERRAPLGDPTVYELRGFRLGLRAEAAVLIQVDPIETPEPNDGAR